MKYKAQFRGCKVGAIGRCYPITAEVEADDSEAARLALYDDFEHISGLKLERDFDHWDDSEYDVEAMKVDDRNGSFDEENAEDYRHENIVRASLVNGQFTQARQQCESYGLSYDLERFKFDGHED